VIVEDIERKSFSDWVLSIRDGTIGESNDVDISTGIPSDLLMSSNGDPNVLDSMSDITYFQDRDILAPKNSIVDQINEYMLDLVPGEEKVYLSYDSTLSQNNDGDAVDDVHTPEFLNTITTSAFWYSKSQAHIKGWSTSDVVEEYKSKIKLMQWYKTTNNQNE
jgi:ATP-dependent DNA helicase PIF1